MSYVVIAEFTVRPDRLQAFAAALDCHAANSRREAGCLAYDVAQDLSDPARFTLYEVYVDAAAHALHRTLPSYAEFFAVVTPMLIPQADGELFLARKLRRRSPAG